MNQPRRKDGRYDHQDMDKLCTCGHRLGVHLAENPRACIAPDFIEHVASCTCTGFKWARPKTRTADEERRFFDPRVLTARTCEACGQHTNQRKGPINAYTINGKRGYWHSRCAHALTGSRAK